MKASFSIWLAHGDKAKTFETVEAVSEVPKVNTTISCTSASNTPQPINSSTLGAEASAKSSYVRKPVGLRNLGQTCYINAILQCLSCVHEIWSSLSADVLGDFQFLKYLVTMLKLMRSGSSCVDPKFLVARLGSFMSKASSSIYP